MQILGKVINVLGRQYHPEHFTCKQCNCILSVNKYFVADGEPVCQVDYAEQFAEVSRKGPPYETSISLTLLFRFVPNVDFLLLAKRQILKAKPTTLSAWYAQSVVSRSEKDRCVSYSFPGVEKV